MPIGLGGAGLATLRPWTGFWLDLHPALKLVRDQVSAGESVGPGYYQSDDTRMVPYLPWAAASKGASEQSGVEWMVRGVRYGKALAEIHRLALAPPQQNNNRQPLLLSPPSTPGSFPLLSVFFFNFLSRLFPSKIPHPTTTKRKFEPTLSLSLLFYFFPFVPYSLP